MQSTAADRERDDLIARRAEDLMRTDADVTALTAKVGERSGYKAALRLAQAEHTSHETTDSARLSIRSEIARAEAAHADRRGL